MVGLYRSIWALDPSSRYPAATPTRAEPFHGRGMVALDHARKGVPVLPVKAGATGPRLVPIDRATTDLAQVATWWLREFPDANIGTPDGHGGYVILPGSIIDGEMVEASIPDTAYATTTSPLRAASRTEAAPQLKSTRKFAMSRIAGILFVCLLAPYAVRTVIRHRQAFLLGCLTAVAIATNVWFAMAILALVR